MKGQVCRFLLIGALGTSAYLILFLLLSHIGAQAASLIARVIVALPTSWLNARLTFRSTVPVYKAYLGGLAGMAVGAGLSALTLLSARGTSLTVETAALGISQLLAAGVRFAVLRRISLPAARSQPGGPSLTAGFQVAHNHGPAEAKTLALMTTPSSSLTPRSTP